MYNFIKKYYIQLIIIMMMFILAVGMLYGSFNVKSTIKDKSKELKQIQLDYTLANEFLQHSYEFKKNAEYIENNSDWISILLPNDDDKKVQLFSILEQLSEDTGNDSIILSVVSSEPKIKQKKVVEKKDVVKDDVMKLNVTLVGNYDDIIYFLQKVENMEYFANISAINMEQTTAETKRIVAKDDDELIQNDLLKSTMTITFYLGDK